MAGADYTQICTLIGSLLGVVSFILYFPLKKRESNAKTESQSVDTLSKVVDGLKKELERKGNQSYEDKKRIDSLEEGQTSLRRRISILEIGKIDNDTAFAASSLCVFFAKNKECPIISKKKELENRKNG